MKTLMKTIFLPAALLVCSSVFGDAPQAPPVPWKVCNRIISHCAAIDPKNGATLYQIDANFSAKESYKVPGWHRSALVSDDGQFFVSNYSGLNLVPMGVTPAQVMVTVWKNGAKHTQVNLGQIVRTWSLLKATASHLNWGSVSHLSGTTLHLNTVDGAVTINIETGAVSHL